MGKNPPYTNLLGPYTIILFGKSISKVHFLHKISKNFVSLHAYLSLHDYLISENCSPYMLIQDSTIIKILRVIAWLMMCLCPTNVISRLLTISGKYELYKRRYIVCTLWMCWKHYLFYLFSSQMEQFKHEYLRSRAYIRLSLSSPFSHYRYSNLTTIEILVLLPWILASKEFW